MTAKVDKNTTKNDDKTDKADKKSPKGKAFSESELLDFDPTALQTEVVGEEEKEDENEKYFELYNYITANRSQLDPQEYVSEELSCRFYAINGQFLIDFLESTNFNKISQKNPILKIFNEASTTEFENIINIMIKNNFIKRVVPITINKKKYNSSETIRVNFAPAQHQKYDPDGLYALLLQQQSTYDLMKSVVIVVGILSVCCFKIWPIILRILLWWLLLFTTVFLISAIVIHLLSKILFTLMCLRGYSFMPNLLDDDIGFFETFSPILGHGGEHQKRWALERAIQIKAREKLGHNEHTSKVNSNNNNNNNEDGNKQQKQVAISPTEQIEDDKNNTNTNNTNNNDKNNTNKNNSKKKQDPNLLLSLTELRAKYTQANNIFYTWQAGLFAFVIFFIAGAIGAYNMGFFDPEMVPDFLVNNNEMRYYFPAIAATSSNNDDKNNEFDSNDSHEFVGEKGEEVSL